MKKHYSLENSNNCVHCYKCVRECPTKAIIPVKDTVIEDTNLCIDCGHCYKMCNKNVHDKSFDVSSFIDFLDKNECVAVLDTTLFMSIYDYGYSQIESALIAAGFDEVRHSFDGLAIHDYLVKKEFKENAGKFFFNSNCMPFIEYIKKFKPEIVENILPYQNATLIAARLAKEKYPNKKIVLITNCFGDYIVDKSNEYIDFVMLGNDVEILLNAKGLCISDFENDGEKVIATKFEKLSGIAPNSVSGFNACKSISDYVVNENPDLRESLRFFICQGGCYNSPAIKDGKKSFERELKYFKFLENNFEFIDCEDFTSKYGDMERFRIELEATPVVQTFYPEETLNTVLESLGIYEDSGERDCNVCGYRSCRKFAKAILNKKANKEQCLHYLMRENKRQQAEMSIMIDELNEAFSLTIPDSKLEKKLKSTPVYKGVYDVNADFLEITEVIEQGLYFHIINSLKISADLQDCNVFSLIGIDKNTLVSAILYHANAKTQPILCVGDVVKYSILFEDKKSEAARSASFAKEFYNVSDDVYNIIKYHKHSETEMAGEGFPKYLYPTYRLFKIIDNISSAMTKSEGKMKIEFKFEEFILYVHKINSKGESNEISIDLYRKFDTNELSNFLKD